MTELSDIVHSGGPVLSASAAADAEVLAQKGLQAANIGWADPARLSALTRMVDERRLRIPTITAFPLDRANEALAEIAAGHVRGKLVLLIG